MVNKQYTPYDDVNAILDILLSDTKETLKEQFIGMYLYGSLSSGDFDPKSSDIDFLIVTEGVLPGKTITALEMLHKRIWASGLKWASKLEGSYIPKDLIRRHARPSTKANSLWTNAAVTGSFSGMSFANMALCWKVPIPRTSLTLSLQMKLGTLL